jgi:hypothetical protein
VIDLPPILVVVGTLLITLAVFLSMLASATDRDVRGGPRNPARHHNKQGRRRRPSRKRARRNPGSRSHVEFTYPPRFGLAKRTGRGWMIAAAEWLNNHKNARSSGVVG